MIKPTNGRVVLFTPSRLDDDDGFTQHDPLVPLAAMVVHVWGDRMVNLIVFDSNGLPWPRTSVQLLQDDDAKPEGGYFCSWMEYQKGQAAKADALEAAAKHEPTAADRKAMSDAVGEGVDKMAKIAGI